jgi:hypothetical protein
MSRDRALSLLSLNPTFPRHFLPLQRLRIVFTYPN